MRSAITVLSALGTAMLCASVLPTPSQARVGVTSATDGDPLGKPPQEAERILRIGIDVQANEVITTGMTDRAHLVFLDGTSLTVGSNAQLTIDKFVYDPDTKIGELAVNASRGVLRLVGGKISKTNPITIATPSATIGIRGGITILDVQPTLTTASFIFGDRMTVSGQGWTQTATRPGSQVTTSLGAPPGTPTMMSKGSLTNALGQLEGTQRPAGSGPNAATASPTTITVGTQTLAAQSAQPLPPAATNAGYQPPPQQWNAAANLPAGSTNGGSVTGNLLTTTPSPSANIGFNLPVTGTATYTGTYLGADSANSIFSGNFSLSWNFGSQNGSLQATTTTTSGGVPSVAITARAPSLTLTSPYTFAGALSVSSVGSVSSGTGTLVGAFTSTTAVAGFFSGTSTSNAATFAGVFTGHK